MYEKTALEYQLLRILIQVFIIGVSATKRKNPAAFFRKERGIRGYETITGRSFCK